ncbi:MAG: HAMP domain-containing protein, partial [Treponema sp.]|nr:HAMP domain-containing protein [Treponema sp.]
LSKLILLVIIPFLLVFGLSSLFIVQVLVKHIPPGPEGSVAVLGPFWGYFFIILIFITGLLLCFTRSITKPIRGLITAAEAILHGDLEREIPAIRSRDEVGVLIRSLRHMVELFQMHITIQKQATDLLHIYTRLHRALYKRDRIEDVFDEVIDLICDAMKVHKVSLVMADGGNVRLHAVFELGWGLQKNNGDFKYHRQVQGLLQGKKYLTFNTAGMAEYKIEFVGDTTLFLCILPVLVNEELRGYIILEGDDATVPLIQNDYVLLFLSETLSYMLAKKEAEPQAAGNPDAGPAARDSAAGSDSDAAFDTDAPYSQDVEPAPSQAEDTDPVPVIKEEIGSDSVPFLEIVRTITELDVDRGLSLIGGSVDQYEDLLRISAKVFSDGARKMHGLYQTDLPAFTIDVHGIKGALYSIGAVDLGNSARDLEAAAREGNGAYCTAAYPGFEERLSILARKLAAVTEHQKGPTLGPGRLEDLTAALAEALEFARLFDSGRAVKSIAPLLEYSWEGEGYPIPRALKKIVDALEGIDYDEADRLILLLLQDLNTGEAGT